MGQIDSGISSIMEIQEKQQRRQDALIASEFRTRLCNRLSQMPGGRTDHQAFCNSLDGMTLQEKRDAINARYGPACVRQVEQLLRQIDLHKG